MVGGRGLHAPILLQCSPQQAGQFSKNNYGDKLHIFGSPQADRFTKKQVLINLQKIEKKPLTGATIAPRGHLQNAGTGFRVSA